MDWLKVFGEMSLDNLLTIAGLVFLGIAVIGKISGKIDPSPSGRVMSGLLGACLLFGGIWIHSGHVSEARGQQTQSSKGQTQLSGGQMPASQGQTPTRTEPTQPSGDQTPTRTEPKPPSEGHPVGLAYFSGVWKNVDINTRGITVLSLRVAGNAVWVHAWGKCSPTDCDWGEVPGTPFAPGVSANVATNAQVVSTIFKTGFSETNMTIRPSGPDLLSAETQTRFTDNSGRSSYSAMYMFKH